ncbi:MAG: LysM peptidoglycan-binding domain-containing protein, partial [Chloroflexi bacterium]|nr:LysM peptidoglycan-binding domain-containing protein [Chloroflexota bacterium]
YIYTLKNSGSTQLGPTPPFTVTSNNTPISCGNADATLAPGATLACSSTYTITAADLNAASITVNATASGGGANPSQAVSLSVSKVAPPAVASGTTVQHTVKEGEWLWQLARCYGTDPRQTVNANLQVDPKLLKIGMVVTITNVGSKGTIYIKSSSDLCVQLHTVVSGDTWTSIAQKYGADPGLTQFANGNVMTVGKTVKVPLYTAGLNIPLSNTTVTTTPSTTALGLTVTPNTTTYSQAGQTITFSYTIKNNGTTTLGPTQFTVTDTFFNPATFNCGAAPITLTPGATTSCTADYKITDADMNAVNIQFSTTASGGGVSTAAVATTITKGIAQLTLTVVPSITTYTQAGQIVNFAYTIKNTGTTTLGPTQFTVTDAFLNPSTFNCGPANTTLAPGATTTCNGSYTITEQDMGAVNIQFSTTASGAGAPTSQAVPTTVTKQ